VDTLEYWGVWRALLSQEVSPTVRFEHVWTPSFPRLAPLETSAAMLDDYVDARIQSLGERNYAEFGFLAWPRQVQAIGHSAGGLHLRGLMRRRSGLVRRVLMVATPNGGSVAASMLLLGASLLPLPSAAEDCLGQRILCQLTPAYVEQVFNPSAPRDPDPGVRYEGLAGTDPGPWGFLAGAFGEPNDGAVGVSSVFHHSVFPPTHAPDTAFYSHSEIKGAPAALTEHAYPLLTGRPWSAGSPFYPSGPATKSLMGGAGWQVASVYVDSADGGSAVTFPLQVAAGSPVRVTVRSLDGCELDLALRDPGGAKWDSAGAHLTREYPFWRFAGGPLYTGECLMLPAPPPGTWSATVSVRSQVPWKSMFVV
jgi:hypothetical protein